MHKLELKNINIETKDKRTVEDVSFIMNSGEIHILMGPNGSGKSSFLNGIFGHPKYKISDGEIKLNGEDITNLSTDKKAKNGLFLSMQSVPEILGVTMLNFLHRAYREISGNSVSILDFNKEVVDRAEKFGISRDFLRRQVNAGLSGGEKKQAEMLQLLALNPKFAFLDEIDSGVDVDSLNSIFSVIDGLKKEGVGFLLITHYPNILKKITPDFVHIMKSGKIVKSGGREIISEIEKNGFGD